MRRWFGLAVLVLAACATPKGTPTQVPMAGENWEVSTITRQELPEDVDQTRWHYLLRLRDVSGAGLRLTQLTRSFPGIDTYRVLPQSATIDLRIEPNGILDIPCWETLFRNPTNFSFTVKKTFTGQDGQGRPVTFSAELPFDTRDHAEPARLLEFAKFTARESYRIPQPHYCETVPNGIREADRRHAVSLNFLIGIRIVFRAAPTQLRTRWFSPGGDAVKVIESGLRHLEGTSGMTLNVHTTHSLPREFFREQPGEWKVELFVDGQNEGVYTIRVI